MFIESFKVESPNVKYTDNAIQSVYNYETTELVHENRDGTYQWVVKPKTVKYEFRTDINVPKLGLESKTTPHFFRVFFPGFVLKLCIKFILCSRVMLAGWGGNNGSTLTGGVIANRW